MLAVPDLIAKRMNMILYKNGIEHIDWPQLIDLYDEVGLVGGLGQRRDAQRIRQAFKSSQKVITAWSGDNLVGAGRLITDGICYGFIVDIGVMPAFQKQGVGKGIMTHLLLDTGHLIVQLYPTKGNIGFYEKLGFAALGSDHPMMRRMRTTE